MNFLITGGAGYIGIELAYAISENFSSSKITIIDSLARANTNVFCGMRKFPSKGKIEFVEADILDSQTIFEKLKEVDFVFHLAAIVPEDRFPHESHLYESINYWGTASVISALERVDHEVTFINISTLEIFSNSVFNPLGDEPNPRSAYAISKFRAERQLPRLRFFEKIRAVNVRSPTVFGYSKNLRVDSAVNRVIFDVVLKGRATLASGSDLQSPHVDIRSLVKFLVHLVYEFPDEETIHPPMMNLSVSDIRNTIEKRNPSIEFHLGDNDSYSFSRRVSNEFLSDHVEYGAASLEEGIDDFISSFTFSCSYF